MGKKAVDISQDTLDLYDAVIASHPEIERKGVTMPYTSVNGHMFTNGYPSVWIPAPRLRGSGHFAGMICIGCS